VASMQIQQWQARPAEVDRPYFERTPATYYAAASTKHARPGAGSMLAWAAPNAVCAWAEWSAHMSCVSGNAHSVVAEAVLGALAAGSATLAGLGFASGTDIGTGAAAVLAPSSLVLGGFGVILWSPSWPAAFAAAVIVAAVNLGIAGVRTVLRMVSGRWVHQAGLAHDAHSAQLEQTRIVQNGETTRTAIAYQRDVDVAQELAVREYLRDLDMHRRYPELFNAPHLIRAHAEVVEDARPALATDEPEQLPAAPRHLELEPVAPAPMAVDDDELTVLARISSVLSPVRR